MTIDRSTIDFTCPFCHMTSHNANDAKHRYCGHCNVFVDDVIAATPALRKVVADFARELATKTPIEARPLLRMAEVWERGLEAKAPEPEPDSRTGQPRQD